MRTSRSFFVLMVLLAAVLFLNTTSVFAGQVDVKWERIGTMPEKLSNTAVVSHLGKAYVIGGNNEKGSTAGFYEFDPKTGEWKKLADMLSPRYGHSAFVYRNRIYAFGGLKTEKGADKCLDSIEAYDFTLKKWVSEGRMPKPMARFAIAHHKLGIMICGGFDDKGTVLNDVYYFYPPGNQWDKMNAMPMAVNRHCAVNLGENCYVMGGENSSGKTLATVYRYDEKKDRWFLASPLKHARKNFAAFVIGSDIVVAGGWNTIGKSRVFISYTEVMNADTNAFTVSGQLEPGRDGCRMTRISDKLYLLGGFNGFITGDVFTGTITKIESGWQIDEAMTFNLAYLDPGEGMLTDANSYSVKAVNFAGEYLPDITNIVLKNILALGFPLPKPENAGELTLYLKFYEYPSTLNQIISVDRILNRLLVYKTINGNVLKDYLKDKGHVQIKMAHIEKTGFAFGASHPYPPLRVARKDIQIPCEDKKMTPQQYFDNNQPFSSLYVKPAKPMPAGLSRDEQAKWSTGGVVAFHKEIIGVYKKSFREITGPEKDKYYFINERMGGRDRTKTEYAIIRVPKEPIIIAGYNDADMPQDPKRIKLSGLLLVYLDTYTAKPAIDLRKIKDAGDMDSKVIQTGAHVFEVGSVVKL